MIGLEFFRLVSVGLETTSILSIGLEGLTTELSLISIVLIEPFCLNSDLDVDLSLAGVSLSGLDLSSLYGVAGA
jgi:hypothetical protein